MTFQRIDNAFAVCEQYLQKIDRSDPSLLEVETYFVSALVVLIVSEYETLIEDYFVKRADQCGDTHVANYIRKTMHERFRSPDIGKITKTLGEFSSDYKKKFTDLIMNSPEHAAWDNLMQARHAVVHKKGSLNLTFRELSESYPKTKKILEEVCNAIGVPL